MGEIRIKVSENLLRKLPERQEDIQEALRLGIEFLNARRKKKGRRIVEKTFAALSVRNHDLIKKVIEQTKYGE